MIVLLTFFLIWSVVSSRWVQDCSDGPAIGSIVDVRIEENEPVQIRRQHDSGWAKAEKGMTLCTGDQIRSRFRSKAHVLLKDGRGGQEVDVVVGVNTRIRTTGDWNGRQEKSQNAPVLEVVHGVVRLKLADEETGAVDLVRTGPSTCRLAGEGILANWDPFKREANYVVEKGDVSCMFNDSTVVVGAGKSLEIASGVPGRVKPTVPLILDAFTRATEFD